MSSPDIVFLSGARTGFGAFGGALKALSATDLGVVAGTAAIERSGLDAAAIDHVVMGNAQQTSADAIYLARHVGAAERMPDRDARAHREPALRLRVRGGSTGRAADPAG